MRIDGSRFVVACHGKEDGPPANGVWQFLVARGAKRLDTIYHPLIREEGGARQHTIYEPGRPARRRTFTLPARPPYSYPLDALLPLGPKTADLFIGFNNLLAQRGLALKRRGRVGQVAYWAVDFVPDRFGVGSPLTRAYDALDAHVCRAADHRIELSQAAAEGRAERHGLGEEMAPTQVVPVGAWLDTITPVPPHEQPPRRAVFVGHLVPRMGLDLALRALAQLNDQGKPVDLDVAGHGEQQDELKALARELGIADRVTFHGFVSNQPDLMRLVAGASVALGPYKPDPSSFTRYADPSKLKGYLATGVPMLITDVPPNADELVAGAGAEVIPYDVQAWADAIDRTISDGAAWRARREASLRYAGRFDWNVILEQAFARMGFET